MNKDIAMNRLDILELQLLVQAISSFKEDKNDTIRRGALALLEKIYNDLKKTERG